MSLLPGAPSCPAVTDLTADWKMTLTIADETVDAETESFLVNIFAAEKDMPATVGPGDVVLLHSVKARWTAHTAFSPAKVRLTAATVPNLQEQPLPSYP